MKCELEPLSLDKVLCSLQAILILNYEGGHKKRLLFKKKWTGGTLQLVNDSNALDFNLKIPREMLHNTADVFYLWKMKTAEYSGTRLLKFLWEHINNVFYKYLLHASEHKTLEKTLESPKQTYVTLCQWKINSCPLEPGSFIILLIFHCSSKWFTTFNFIHKVAMELFSL